WLSFPKSLSSLLSQALLNSQFQRMRRKVFRETKNKKRARSFLKEKKEEKELTCQFIILIIIINFAEKFLIFATLAILVKIASTAHPSDGISKYKQAFDEFMVLACSGIVVCGLGARHGGF